jgi:hypothetical protein
VIQHHAFNDQAKRYCTGNLRDVYFYRSQLQSHVEREYRPGGEIVLSSAPPPVDFYTLSKPQGTRPAEAKNHANANE